MTAPSLRFKADLSAPVLSQDPADALDELCAAGHLSGRTRRTARQMANDQETSVSDILVAAGWAEPDILSQANRRRWGAEPADLASHPPPRALIDQVGVEVCLRYGLIPWRKFAGGVVIACADPAKFDRHVDLIPAELGRPIMALADRSEIQSCIANLYKDALIVRAETRGEPGMTCRSLAPVHPKWVVAAIALLALVTFLSPTIMARAAFMLTLTVLLLTTAQKVIMAAAAAWVDRRSKLVSPVDTGRIDRAPAITLFVPLLREAEVAAKLITAMEALRYPRALLEIMVLVEEDDSITQAALGDLHLQPHMRMILVPQGSLKTKPRAMNYALPFARGDIIGIYDAEDRPEPDQLLKVAAAFATAPTDVACLQGRLAFYNTRQNLLSRCFALDYAVWFRMMLPGLAALNMPIPLGGTTVFIRRHVIDKLDGWDAHNVTEDAELGFRIYCAGYRVQLLDSTTFEEANCHVWPWIKQRSRWMKGYLKTWLMLMRKPARLLDRMGLAGFLSFQILVLAPVGSALTAPVLWSLILPILGFGHVMLEGWSAPGLTGVLASLFICEAVTLGIFARVAIAHDLRHVLPCVAALPVYFLLATPAAIRALVETALNPHHWEKTSHGLSEMHGPIQKTATERGSLRRNAV